VGPSLGVTALTALDSTGQHWTALDSTGQHWTALGSDSVRPNYVTAKLVEEVLRAELTMAPAEKWQQLEDLL